MMLRQASRSLVTLPASFTDVMPIFVYIFLDTIHPSFGRSSLGSLAFHFGLQNEFRVSFLRHYLYVSKNFILLLEILSIIVYPRPSVWLINVSNIFQA